MINIIVNGDYLDIYEEDITWSWTAFRFQDKLKDQYTNDFTIPKTDNNLRLLDITSILDNTFIGQFGKRISPAILQIESLMIDVYLKISEITRDAITISVFEDKYTSVEKSHVMNDDHIDDENSIFAWNKYSMTWYPQNFCSYYYGMNPLWKYAQRHPYIPLIDYINTSNLNGFTLRWNYQNDWRLLASKKTVCPQNNTQVVQYRSVGKALTNDTFPCRCSQHITNDAEYEMEDGVITFNRDCTVAIDFWILWEKKGVYSPSRSDYIYILQGQPGNYNVLYPIEIQAHYYSFGTRNTTTPINVRIQAGDRFFIRFSKANHYKNISMVLKLTISDYVINKEDYDQDLTYIPDLPALYYVTNNVSSPDNYTWDSLQFDGVTYSWRGRSINTQKLSFSYFGVYCNIPEMKLGDVLYSLQWMTGGKLTEDVRANEIFFDNTEWIYPVHSFSEYDNIMDNMNPTTDVLGQNNYIKYKNDNPEPLVNIKNVWLEKDKTLHELCFYPINDCNIPQYTIEYREGENPGQKLFSVKYNEIDAPVVFNYNTSADLRYRAERIPFIDFGIKNITEAKECTFTFFTNSIDFSKYDSMNVDGRLYYIVDGEYNLKDKKTTVKALLCSPIYLSTVVTNVIKTPNSTYLGLWDILVHIQSSTNSVFDGQGELYWRQSASSSWNTSNFIPAVGNVMLTQIDLRNGRNFEFYSVVKNINGSEVQSEVKKYYL